MRMSITAEQIESIPGATNVLLRKVVDKLKLNNGDTSRAGRLSRTLGLMSFNAYFWSHSHIQAFLDNDIVINSMDLYSPIMSDNQINTDVPLNWPGGHTVDEDDVVVSRLTYAEYMRPTEVIGGTVLQFAGGPMDANRNITLPSFAQLKLQITAAGGFLTRSEVDDIRIIPEEI